MYGCLHCELVCTCTIQRCMYMYDSSVCTLNMCNFSHRPSRILVRVQQGYLLCYEMQDSQYPVVI